MKTILEKVEDLIANINKDIYSIKELYQNNKEEIINNINNNILDIESVSNLIGEIEEDMQILNEINNQIIKKLEV